MGEGAGDSPGGRAGDFGWQVEGQCSPEGYVVVTTVWFCLVEYGAYHRHNPHAGCKSNPVWLRLLPLLVACHHHHGRWCVHPSFHPGFSDTRFNRGAPVSSFQDMASPRLPLMLVCGLFAPQIVFCACVYTAFYAHAFTPSTLLFSGIALVHCSLQQMGGSTPEEKWQELVEEMEKKARKQQVKQYLLFFSRCSLFVP